jgi:hypothetical protein
MYVTFQFVFLHNLFLAPIEYLCNKKLMHQSLQAQSFLLSLLGDARSIFFFFLIPRGLHV